MKFWKYLLAGFAFGTVAVAADFDLASKMINRETNGSWYFVPDKPKPKHMKADVFGDYAFRVKARKGNNPWDMQASSPIAGAIHEGDVVMVIYYARAEVPAEGGSSLTLRLQMNSPPWTSVLDTTNRISEKWERYCAVGSATATLAENKGSVSIHLATADQTIDLGAVLVFNFGKDFDPKSLASTCNG